MTRFARAKGSKASNEKLPEQATSWSEMKQELLNKNNDLAEKQKRAEALKQRQANYQAFLQEREEEEDKKIAWADFPDANSAGNNIKTATKRKASTGDNDNSFMRTNFSNKKAKKVELTQFNGGESDNSEDSDGQFSELKSQLDKILDKQDENNSDSDDAPPEEVSIKEKPQEIVVKKPKKPTKQKLKIVLDKEEQFLSRETSTNKIRQQKTRSVKETCEKDKEVAKRLIEKKTERQRKQAGKKKLKKEEQKALEKRNDLNPAVPRPENIDPEKLQKKLERRKKQKEKKKMQQQESGLQVTVKQEKPENLSEEDLKKIQKKKERRARQAEKRKQIREAKALEVANGEGGAAQNKSQIQNSNGPSSNFHESNSKFNGKKGFSEQDQSNEFTERKSFQKPLNNQQKKPAKPRDNKEHPGRKQKPEIMFINGKTVEIDYIDGFPVKKEDADRLKKLRKEMISKGLPRSEINVSLKLERRRAEKAFSREKKNVSFSVE